MGLDMAIERTLGVGSACELRFIEVEHDLLGGKLHYQRSCSIADGILKTAKEDGSFESDGNPGRIIRLVYKDIANSMPYLNLTYEEFVEQGKPLTFRRTLVYEPVKEEKK